MRVTQSESVQDTQYLCSTITNGYHAILRRLERIQQLPHIKRRDPRVRRDDVRAAPQPHNQGRAHDRNCHQFPLSVWFNASHVRHATACVDWPTANTCQHRYRSAVEKIQSSSIPLRRDWPPGRLNGASELVGSAKSPPIGPASPPNRPVPGSPEHFSRGFI